MKEKALGLCEKFIYIKIPIMESAILELPARV